MPTLHVNGEAISADPGETILQSALRAGIDFPFRCRVGGCGACKCQVTAGSVRELTESSYLLSEAELAQGTVLACQSAPQGDVRVAVELPVRAAPTPVAPADTRPIARPWHYARYALFHALGLFAVFSLLGGGWITTLGLVGVVSAYLLGDTFGGDDTASLRFTRPGVLKALLWAGLPLMALIAFTATWTVCTTDPFGFGAALTWATGVDVLAARDATAPGHHASGLILAVLANGLVSLIAGHELVHRTWDKPSLVIGRLLYAFAFDANFSIEHVYGHHRYVATTQDPATAPRGRSVYAHVVISTLRGNVSSWRIESERLRKRGQSVLSWHNVCLRGHAMNVGLVAVAWAMGGPVAAAFYLGMALGGKAILEMVNYLEHYGMVRAPDDPVAPHHSWNTNRRVSSWAMFNLTRHSHHHAQGEVPFHELRPFPDAPTMINGYLATMFVAMVPPLWHHWMTPKVQEWDQRYASDRERELAERANQSSGIGALMSPARAPAKLLT
jgi:alkane 1-monooxygenase